MDKERRQFERYSVDIPVLKHDLSACGMLHDISMGGFAIKSTLNLKTESDVFLIFKVEQYRIRLKGQVKVKLKKTKGFVYGIRFYSEKLDVTERLVKHRQKINSMLLSTSRFVELEMKN